MTAELESEVKFLAQSLAYLLECTMATYEHEALKTKPKKSELNRHESILKTVFMANYKAMAEARASSSFAIAAHRTTPRVDKVLNFMTTRGDDAESAITRYTNEIRYGIGK